MKKFNLMVLIASSMIFVACGDDAKTEQEVQTKVVKAVKAEPTTAKLAENVKQDLKKTVDDTKKLINQGAKDLKKQATEAVDTAKKKATEMIDDAKVQVASASKTAKEKLSSATDALKSTVVSVGNTDDAAKGASLYTKCAGCHGQNGKTKALGKSAVIAGQDKAVLVASISGYKAGSRNVSGMGTLMKSQVAGMSEADIEAVASYISTLK